jgi:Flp pilus assembly protein TadG
MRTRSRSEPAQIIVLFALSLVAICALMAVILDGGTLFLQRRTVQNAADAAALAGTRALQQATISPTGNIGTAVCAYLVANAFGITPTATAYFVAADGITSLGPIALPAGCIGTAPNSSIVAGTSGVHVDATIGPYNTYMAGIVGIPTLTAKAAATAQVGGLAIPAGAITPLAGCGPDMLFNGTSDTPYDNILLGGGATPYSINPAKYGDDVVLQGSQLPQHSSLTLCPTNGGSASWKGKIVTTGITPPLVLPSTVPIDTGNGDINALINAGCTNTGQPPATAAVPPPDVCFLLVPIAAPPNPSGQANIVLFACFSMYNPMPGYQIWRGILHPVADCPYGLYVPGGWTWGNGISQTHVLLSL